MTSPYRAVLGAAFDELHPRLRAYFDAIPAGAVGRGSGVFETVGTPRRWLWPVLAVFARSHVMFPVWEREAPFTVENRAVTSPDGSPAVAATRWFALRSGAATMVDEIGVRRGTVIDRLGDPVRAEARFAATVRDGGLRLRSTAVWLVVGGRRVRVPSPLAPVVVLTERWDDQHEHQRVSITVHVPLIGRIYQYRGRFRYAIEPGGPAAQTRASRNTDTPEKRETGERSE
ncbi:MULTISPECIES: DUF4166 domain-containing protein [unclassified Leifsonia]|uniref:DUF4166 domain-containing protein n=1 Tax=unclassified Leifsonia TaxID=2663824 RepID=UPI000362C1FD|nr:MULTISPECIES: DUF4166 domain-containing protein [unclassified Leifsonia]TDP99934.1 uncharacterized protein DUF4166 [Leifsonia sp. 115AMFTsu3.1]